MSHTMRKSVSIIKGGQINNIKRLVNMKGIGNPNASAIVSQIGNIDQFKSVGMRVFMEVRCINSPLLKLHHPSIAICPEVVPELLFP